MNIRKAYIHNFAVRMKMKLLILLLLFAFGLKAQLFSKDERENRIHVLSDLLSKISSNSHSEIKVYYISKDLNANATLKGIEDELKNASYHLAHTRSYKKVKKADILIIDEDLNSELNEIAQNHPTSLIICENLPVGNPGINFILTKDGAYRFEVNQEALTLSHLELQSSLKNSDKRILDASSWQKAITQRNTLIEKQKNQITLIQDSLETNKDSLLKAKSIISLQDQNIRLQKDSIENAQYLVKTKQALVKEQDKTISYLKLLLIISVIALALIMGLFWVLRKENKAKKVALESLEVSNKEILDSLNYAQNIQRAILPKTDDFKRIWPKSFVLFKPKDIVSGDFYWTRDFGYVKLLCVADCTGHGVPGALMSMMGHEIFDTVTALPDNKDTSTTLEIVDKRIVQQINKDGSQLDGMDASLIAYFPEQQKIQFSGANNALYQLREGKIKRIEASRFGLGGGQESQQKIFRTVEFEVKDGDYYFLTTDGIQDQFGGDPDKHPYGKKMGRKRLIDFMEQTELHDLSQFKIELENYIQNWKGDFEQIDDMCMVGIQINLS